tara:strand:+ start:397881 stop:399371 length:1491 start_codon:yes stop_codon:yes gene_type:complete
MSLNNIEETFQRLSKLGHLSSIVGWDEAVNMSKDGGEKRAQAMAELMVIKSELINDPKLAESFQSIDEASLSLEQRSHFQEMKRSWQAATVLSSDFIKKSSLAKSKCHNAWRELRAENNWDKFKPYLEEVVNFTREEAKLRSEATGLSPYDSLLDLYEPSGRSEDISKVFAGVKSFLPDLIKEVVEKQKSEKVIYPKGPFSTESQKQLGLDVMKILNFNFDRGRLDVSHHPFCGGVPTDIRMTTRYSEDDFTESLMGVIHETGHACYEQNLPHDQWGDFPVGTARSMGIHESQSLLFEMQIGRGQSFLKKIAPLMKKYFSNEQTDEKFFEQKNLELFYTRVKPDYIRVNADEVTYPAHVILRYEIEKDLLEGKVEVKDLPELWDVKMQEYLGLSTKDNFKDGVMQDVHWPSGAIGYFPTYTLGAMNAAQIKAKMNEEISGLEDSIEQGDFSKIHHWLGEKIWSKGSQLSINDLMVHATGESLNPKYFEDHLRKRYL